MRTPNPPSMPIRQKGYTLVELAIAIAILSVLVVAGLTGVQSILISGKVNDQIKSTSKLASKVALISSGASGNISALNETKEWADLGGWDASRVDGSGNVTTSFGTSETAVANTSAISGMAINSGVFNTVKGVPKSACADYANGISNVAYAIHIGAAEASFTSLSFTTTSAKPPGSTLSLSNLAAQCGGTGDKFDFFIALKP